MNPDTTQDLRRRLEQERLDLLHQLEEYGVDPETGAPREVEFEHGFADSGQSTAEKANLLSLAESSLETLHEVDAALKRIEAGTFGTCESCGNQIPPERMEARPHARLCMSCMQKRG
ncbi:MAG TPA: TraR/DksA family transcriptional regulator [Actinomycetota bacterium]|nr:TraR/DksA family transcriptional regulator [Actinomycetota bacterium]